MTDKMLEHTRVQLSALFDGELGQDEARFLRKRLEHDAELAACVSRWQLAGDILRGQATAAAPAGFAGKVAVAIAAEAPLSGTAAGRNRRWLPGAALAASVAVVAMFMARQAPDLMPVEQPAPVEMAGIATGPQVPPADPAPAPATPQLPGAAAQLAAATVAAAEVPRRAAARRASSSRGQAQRAAATRISRESQAQPQLAAVGAGATGADVATSDANPFAPDAATITTRPWPRALLPDAGGAFNVGYGNLQPTADFPRDVHPFRPVPAPTAETHAPQLPDSSPR